MNYEAQISCSTNKYGRRNRISVSRSSNEYFNNRSSIIYLIGALSQYRVTRVALIIDKRCIQYIHKVISSCNKNIRDVNAIVMRAK